MTIRPWLAAAAAALCLGGAPAHADDFPARPLRVIVGFSPGSAADVAARVIATRISTVLDQQFVVENKPGVGSSLAAEYVAHAPKDGYTLLVATSANLTNAVISTKPNFDFVKDLTPVVLMATTPVILVVNPVLGVDTVGQLIALAKNRPGQILYGSTGIGAAPHLSGELFNARAGVRTVHVPYQGSLQAVADLVAGRTMMMFSPASSVMPYIQSGKLKALASATARRPSIAPDLPTMAEAGMPDFDTSIWLGLMAPSGTPQPVVDKLARAVNEALKSDEVVTGLEAQGFEKVGGTSEDFGRTIGSDVTRWTTAARAAGLKK